MINSSDFLSPRISDAVLGGQNLVPVAAVVLGGLEGIKSRLQSNSQAARIDAIFESVNYGEAGLELAIALLDDPDETVQAAAFGVLNSNAEKLSSKRRRLQSNNGAEVDTFISDALALKIIGTLSHQKFAGELCAKSQKYQLTESQLVWVHKLAIEELERRAKELFTLKFSKEVALDNQVLDKIVEMYEQAAAKLQKPEIWLAVDKERQIILRQTQSVKYAGAIKIISPTNRPYGRIQKSASEQTLFIKLSDCPEWVSNLIDAFAENPVGVAAEYGKLTGRCCFCRNRLTDSRSTAVGYGKHCAANYGLPWGQPSN